MGSKPENPSWKSVADSMTPEDRAHMIAIADGCGKMLMAMHRPESEAFAARYPGVAVVRDGYKPFDGDRYIARRRWFSIEPTLFGVQVARMIERFDMPVVWPELEEAA